MSAHVHAALMLQYAQDAAETDSPWERWETSESKTKIGDEWVDDWEDLTKNPDWHPDVGYRRKSNVRLIGNIEIPVPLQEEPDMGCNYYFVVFKKNPKENLHEFMVCVDEWRGRIDDFRRLLSNTCHLVEEDAEIHANALDEVLNHGTQSRPSPR